MTNCKPARANHKWFKDLCEIAFNFDYQIAPRIVLCDGITKKAKQ